MIGERENGCQKTGNQRAKYPRAQEKKTAEGKSSKKGMSVRILNTSDSLQDKDSQCCQGDRCSASSLRIWTNNYKSDPCIALGKYSPLEKEILVRSYALKFLYKEVPWKAGRLGSKTFSNKDESLRNSDSRWLRLLVASMLA